MDKSAKAVTWGPKYWYVLHSMAMNYPLHPNKVTKKKYYDTVMNWPLFLPHPEMGSKFSKMLDKYPVSPYLDSRESFIKWTHFIHNRVNEGLGKPIYPYSQFIDDMMRDEERKPDTYFQRLKDNKNLIVVILMLIIIAVIYKLL